MDFSGDAPFESVGRFNPTTKRKGSKRNLKAGIVLNGLAE
jgi:hypothetical protein